jgi:hypothetical protein
LQAQISIRRIVALTVIALITATLIVQKKDSSQIEVPFRQPPDAAIPLPTGYITYGPYDSQGIPLRDFRGKIGVVYHPLVVAEFGSYYDALARATNEEKYFAGLLKMADWLIEHINESGFWTYEFASSYAGISIDPPWVSAVAQGYCAQTLIKGAKATGDQRYLRAAQNALRALLIPVERGGVRTVVDGGYFYEEFPGKLPTHILNGHLTALQAVLDYLALDRDTVLDDVLAKGLLGLDSVLKNYDTGYWSRYDQLPPMEPLTQFLVVGVRGKESPQINVISENPAIQIVGRPNKIGIANYQSLGGRRLDPLLNYFQIELRGEYTGAWSPPTARVNLSGDAIQTYLTWPENKRVLLAVDITKSPAGTPMITLPGVLLGHATGKSYHHMIVEQLEQLAQSTNKSSLADVAKRWRTYEDQYRNLVERE